MATDTIPQNTEAAILGRLIEGRERMSKEIAEYLLSFDFGREDTNRMNELSELARQGRLSSEESAELSSYTHVGNLLTIMQSKARVYLRERERGSRQ